MTTGGILSFLLWKYGLPRFEVVFGMCLVRPGKICEACRRRCQALLEEIATLLLLCWISVLLYTLPTHFRAIHENGFWPFHTSKVTVCVHILSLYHEWIDSSAGSRKKIIFVLFLLNPRCIHLLLDEAGR